MAERTDFAPGTFCWTDLTTPDPEGAKTFYGGLFGWGSDDVETPSGTYSLQTLGGKVAAAITGQPPQQQGVPPLWNSYVRVQSADATVARAKELGVEPHAARSTSGRPAAWPCSRIPRARTSWPGSRTSAMARISSTARACCRGTSCTRPTSTPPSSFYGDLLGWSISTMGEGAQRYDMIEVAGQPNGGISGHLDEGVPPHWLVYFGSDDNVAAVARAEELGGTTLMGDMRHRHGPDRRPAGPAGRRSSPCSRATSETERLSARPGCSRLAP